MTPSQSSKLALFVGLLGVTFAATTPSCSSGGGGDTDEGGKGGSGGGGRAGSGGAGGGGRGGNAGGSAAGASGGGGTSAAGSGGGGASGGSGGGGGAGSGGAGSGGAGNGGVSIVTNTATCKPPALKLVRVATAGDSPMALVQAKGDARMFVAQRAGLVRILRNGTFDATSFADLRPNVLVQGDDNTSERGLLGFALHPKFPTDKRFYVFYTRKNTDPASQGGNAGDIIIAEGNVSAGNADRADSALKVIKRVTHTTDYHIGGFLAFGPDGMLYAGTGDGGGGTDAQKAGQDPTRTLSKILRFDVDRLTERPAGNLDKPGADIHTWAYGVRNPFRGSFDAATGDLFFGDVGEMSYEEVDWVPPGKSQLNFGWGYDPTVEVGIDKKQTGMEGNHPVPFFTALPWEPFGYLPIVEYPHDGPGWMAAPGSYMEMGFGCMGGGSCSRAVVGGVVYRGKKAALYGRYFYGDHVKNQVQSFVVDAGKATCQADVTSDLSTGGTLLQGITAFGNDAEGEVYILDIMNNIYRVDLE